MYEYDYGRSRRSGLPVTTLQVVEFPSMKEAKKAVNLIEAKDHGDAVCVTAEIISGEI